MKSRFTDYLPFLLIPVAFILSPHPASGQAGSVSFSASAVPVNEGVGNAMITVERTGGSSGSISVEYATEDGSATAGLDYTMTTGTLSWSGGDGSSRTIMVPIVDDGQDEQPETFKVRLTNPTGGATLGIPVTTTVTILDDDEPGLCTSGATTLCLNDGRFEVTASWVDFQGTAGMGMARQLTNDTGYFWFFNANNVEIVIKVLDACRQPSNHFWVFAAGLTNVQVDLRVTDTESGQTKTYRNRLGQAFQPIQDTSAFATCP